MEKRETRRRKRQGVVVMLVSVTMSVGLALAIVGLEVRRTSQTKVLQDRLELLEQETVQLRKQIEQCLNATKQLAQTKENENSAQGRHEEDDYDEYYYDDDSETFDDEEEEEEEQSNPKHGGHHQHGNGTSAKAGSQHQTSSAIKRRLPRSIGHKYNVVISQNSKYGPSSKPPLEVQARIVVEKEGAGFHAQEVGPPATVTRHGHGCHYQPLYERRSRVMVTEPSTRPDRTYHEQVGQRESSVVNPPNGRRDRKKFNGGGGGRGGGTEVSGHHGIRHSAGCSSAAVHYEADGRMKHISGKVKDWMMTEWRSDFKPDPRAHFRMDREGDVTIEEPGVYYVYAQLFFASRYDVSGYQIFKNREVAFQCTVTSAGAHLKRNTCYTGGLLDLAAGDRLSVKEETTYSERLMRFEKGMSFFGMYKVN